MVEITAADVDRFVARVMDSAATQVVPRRRGRYRGRHRMHRFAHTIADIGVVPAAGSGWRCLRDRCRTCARRERGIAL